MRPQNARQSQKRDSGLENQVSDLDTISLRLKYSKNGRPLRSEAPCRAAGTRRRRRRATRLPPSIRFPSQPGLQPLHCASTWNAPRDWDSNPSRKYLPILSVSSVGQDHRGAGEQSAPPRKNQNLYVYVLLSLLNRGCACPFVLGSPE